MIGFQESTAANRVYFEPPYQARPEARPLAWLKEQALWGTPIWAVCSNCDHSRLVDAADLLALTGKEVTALAQVSDRMRCRACGSKACDLRAATPIPEYAQ